MNNLCLDIVGIRLVKENKLLSDEPITTPEQAIKILANELKYFDREVMFSVNLNQKNQIINAHIVSVGTIKESIVDPKSIFKASLLSNASKIILLHNHPSGNCTPSKEDYLITDKIRDCCNLFQMKLVDHIVIGKGSYYSINCETEFEMDEEIEKEDYEL